MTRKTHNILKHPTPSPQGLLCRWLGTGVWQLLSNLAFWLDSSLSFSMHIDNLQSKVKTRLCFLYWNEAFFMYSVKYILVKNYYCHPDWLRWCNLSNYIKEHLSKLNTLHHLAVCFATGAPFATHHCNLYKMMGWYSLNIGWLQHWLWLLDKTVFGKTPC